MESTKYVLNGGHAGNAIDQGKAFYTEILDGLPNKVEALSCFFARPESKWEQSLEKTDGLFKRLVPDRKVNMQIATRRNFLSQLEDSHVLLIHGGSSEALIQTVRQFPRLKEVLVGKTVAGISAGAHMISKFFLNVRADGTLILEEGLGHLSIKVTVHYRSGIYDNTSPDIFDWDNADEFLRNRETNLQTINLREGEFTVIES
jgi:peptidase E